MSNAREAKRIVVKVGTSTLTHASGHINIRLMEKLVKVLADIKNTDHAGKEIFRRMDIWILIGSRTGSSPAGTARQLQSLRRDI